MKNLGFVTLTLALACPGSLRAQFLEVYSEFQRITPEGRLVRADDSGDSREILSPSVARNSRVLFRVVARVARGVPYHLYVGQNPENAFQVRTYREFYVRRGEEWIPDRLSEVRLPYTSVIPEPEIPNQQVQTFLLEMYTPPGLEPDRYRVEVQMFTGGQWIIYPMEVRVEERSVPSVFPVRYDLLGNPEDPADAPVLAPLAGFLCGSPQLGATRAPEDFLSPRFLIRRGIEQDLALARERETDYPPDELKNRLAARGGIRDLGAWCKQPKRPDGESAEWYLRIRDYLYRGRKPV